MERREALKKLGFATGFFVFTPTLIDMLENCERDIENWNPEFFSLEQSIVLTELVDTILPKTENLPSASEINVPQFIDKYVNEVIDNEAKKEIKVVFNNIISTLKSDKNTSVDAFSKRDYKALLDKHLLLQKQMDPQDTEKSELSTMSNSDFLNQIKAMTIKAYLTTEQIGEQVLVYEPVPAKYYCGDLQELTGGKSYSLK